MKVCLEEAKTQRHAGKERLPHWLTSEMAATRGFFGSRSDPFRVFT
jgi:hypothetical protein